MGTKILVRASIGIIGISLVLFSANKFRGLCRWLSVLCGATSRRLRHQNDPAFLRWLHGPLSVPVCQGLETILIRTIDGSVHAKPPSFLLQEFGIPLHPDLPLCSDSDLYLPQPSSGDSWKKEISEHINKVRACVHRARATQLSLIK